MLISTKIRQTKTNKWYLESLTNENRMKTKHYVFIFTVLINLFLTNFVQGQVTIGSGEAPEKHALLQIKDKVFVEGDEEDGITALTGGLLLPRVELTKRTELLPFVTDLNDPAYPSIKLKHTGLIVYNRKEVKEEKLSRGLNMWNGSEWKGIAEVLGKAEFNYCATAIEVKGTYIENKELTSSNYLKLRVVVSSPGSYEITGSCNNGYFFTASGQFLAEGTYTIYAQGQGTPLTAGTNILTMTNNGDNVTCPDNTEVTVLSSIANYSLDCTGTVVNGLYTLGNNLSQTNTITMKVNVKSLGSWGVSSPETDGISFYGSGEFTTTGIQYITLHGSGKPSSGGSISIALTSNSVGGVSMNCSAVIPIVIPPKKILSFGGLYGLGVGSAGYNLLMNQANFGTNINSTVKVQNIQIGSSLADIFYTSTTVPAFSNRTVFDLLLGENPVDIVFIGYASRPIDGAARQMLIDYMKKGGVVIWADENTSLSGRAFFQLMYDDLTLTAVEDVILGGGGGTLYKLPFFDDLILNGPFGDIRGSFIGEDAGYADGFPISGPISQLTEWYYNGYNHAGNTTYNNTTLPYSPAEYVMGFKAKNYPFVWFGDGGIFVGNSTDASTTIYPAKITADNKPTNKIYGNGAGGTNSRMVVNSTLLANLMTWALLKAETEGINSK